VSAFARPLVALSLTEPDEGLLRYAALAVGLCGCQEVLFAHALPDRPEAPGPQTVADCLERMRQEVERHFSPAAPGLRLAFEAAGRPRIDLLLALAVQHQRDLILLGHRRSRSGRRSLARRLAMIAPCSVWLVPEGSPARVRGVLVPTDFSSHSADALAVAASLARAAGLDRCNCVHVYFDPSMVRYDEHVEEVRGQEQAAFERFRAPVQTHGLTIEPVFEESTHPPEAILRAAERTGSDLVVMNTRGRSRAAAVLLGSVTSQTMISTTIPLLAVKHFGARMTLIEALLNHRFWEHDSPKTN
jgi:nucleotide-binding universal stress UspA family protein